MFRNRFRLPAPPPPAPAADAFVMLPASALPERSADQVAAQKALYEWALAEAQAVVRPSLPERDLLGVWN
ncbi:MAG: hypothetical protein U0797_05180 [Gemmataceae bacterium]